MDDFAHREMCSQFAKKISPAVCEENQLEYIYGGTYAKMAALGALTSSDAGPLKDKVIMEKLTELQEQWCVDQHGRAKYHNLPGTRELAPCASRDGASRDEEALLGSSCKSSTKCNGHCNYNHDDDFCIKAEMCAWGGCICHCNSDNLWGMAPEKCKC